MEDKYLRRINFSNKAKRVPICFCIDTSYSMKKIIEGVPTGQGQKVFRDQREYIEYDDKDCEGCTLLIDKVYDGIMNFYAAISDDDMACDSCEAAIITFNDNPTICDGFSPIDEKDAPDFSSYMGENTNVTPAIRMALDLLAKQKEFYKNNKISYFQPWLVLFTDGLPTDDVSAIKRELMQMQDDDKLSVYTMALSDDPDLLNALRGFSKKQPIRCTDPKEIQRFFDFLAKSVSVVAGGGIPKDFF